MPDERGWWQESPDVTFPRWGIFLAEMWVKTGEVIWKGTPIETIAVELVQWPRSVYHPHAQMGYGEDLPKHWMVICGG